MPPAADGRAVRVVGFVLLIGTAAAAALVGAAPHSPMLSLAPPAATGALRIDFARTAFAQPFLAVIALVVPGVATWNLKRGAAADGLRLTAFVLTMAAVLLAQSVAAFFIAWETMSLASAFLVGTHHERRDVRRALLSYLLVSQLGALCILAALAILGEHAGSFRFADIALAAPTLPLGLRCTAIALAVVGFGSKAGLVPLHFWLPLAHPVAPANASALLSGVMLNVAVYGLLVTGWALAAPVPLVLGTIVVSLGLLTAIVGALYAAVDSDLKRLLAYSSIENLGIIVSVLGLAFVARELAQPALAGLALLAMFVQTVGHALFKSLLFLGAGTVTETARTTDLEHLGGLHATLPLSAPLVLVGCAAAAALPPTVGFAAEWLAFRAYAALLPVAPAPVQALLAIGIALLAAASGLAALAFVKLFGIAFLGQPRSVRPPYREAFDVATAGLGWAAGLAVVFGVAPAAVLRPLVTVAGALSGTAAIDAGPLPSLPATLALLPLLGAAAMLFVARRRGVRAVPGWSCGSLVTPRSQYTATAFSKPTRRVFGFVLFPDHQEIRDRGTSRWFPLRIRYEFTTRYVVDEVARNIAAFAQRLARRTRIVQAGFLRVYLIYAVVAVLVVLVAAR